jgi:prepilin peptidase CpaA
MIMPPALWLAIAAMVPLMALCAWYDLKSLRIPNWLVLGVFGVFLVTGSWGLPGDVFIWRLVQGAMVLAVGFLLFLPGFVGGGDAKMAAALAPFVAISDALGVLILYAVVTLALLLVLRLAMQFSRHRATGGMAVDQYARPARERVFPMGLIFAITIVVYLLVGAAEVAG